MDLTSYLEIDLNKLVSNMSNIRSKTKVKIMGIVKADAYGQGLLEVAHTLVDNNIDCLGVANINEALTLREKFEDIPIHILGYVPTSMIKEAILNNFTLTIFNKKFAQEVSRYSKELKVEAIVHLKINTGLNRLGFKNNLEDINELVEISKMPSLNIEGIFTHFASTDSEKMAVYASRFNEMVSQLKNHGISFKHIHCSGGGTIMGYPELNYTMVRPGSLLYGLQPVSNKNNSGIEVSSILSLKSKIIAIQEIKTGEGVGYGETFIAKKNMKVGIIPIGYADGLPRQLSNNGRVLVNEKFAPIIGRICMDQTMIDLSTIESANLEDEVVLIGKQGEESIAVDELAQSARTNNDEIVCGFSNRLPRIYLEKSNTRVVNRLIRSV